MIKVSDVLTELQEIGSEVATTMSILRPGKQIDPNFMTAIAMQVQQLRHIEKLGGIGPNLRESLYKMLKDGGWVE